MYQTGIKSISAPAKVTDALGGICRWWYVPVHWIATFPKIDFVTQQYESSPTLLPGFNWLGPINVPDGRLGFEEVQETAKPGPWYKSKVSGHHPGDTVENRIMRENMARMQFVIIAQIRAAEIYVLLGSLKSGYSYDQAFKTGVGGNKSFAGNDFTMTGESPYLAPVIKGFVAGGGGVLPTGLLYKVSFAYTAVNPFINNNTAPVMSNLFEKDFALDAPIVNLFPQAAQDLFLIWKVPVIFLPKTVWDNGPYSFGQVGDAAVRPSFVVGGFRYYITKSLAGFPFNYLIPITLQ